MTPEQEIAALKAEVARERARADGLQEIVHALTVKRRTSGAERQARYRARRSDVTSDASPPPSPPSPFPSSFPPSPAPSSPYPLSFPPSSPPPSASQEPAVPPREDLRLDPEKPPKTKRPKPDNPPDPRHAPLSLALVALGWPHHGGRTAKAIRELLGLANQHCLTHGGDVPGEVQRRAALAKAHDGFPRVRELHELVTHWGHFERQPTPARGPAPPSNFDEPTPTPHFAWLDPPP